mgnify:CR=1 FL=1
MAYSLKEINDAVRSDPKGFAEACDAAFAKKWRRRPRRLPITGRSPASSCCPAPPAPARPPTALKIEEQLEKMGIQTHTISMDNYFNTIDPETAPRNREGAIDYESPFCLDIELLNRHFSMLDRGETIHVPKYEFARQMRSDILSQPLKLGPDELAIFEGIHALNDVIVGKNPKASSCISRPGPMWWTRTAPWCSSTPGCACAAGSSGTTSSGAATPTSP